MKSLIDVAKHENKLRKIIELNIAGAIAFTDKTSQALAIGVSKSEFIEAFKDDIDKTARFLVDSLGIINSISNGLVLEIDSLDNSVEEFFKSTYKDGIITLCGVEFDIRKKLVFEKGEYIDYIYKNLFDITRKDLNLLVKALANYESADLDFEKAVLYPSIILADKLIEKMGYIDTKFNEFRKKLTYEEQVEFATMFNRSGVCDVIQNSTYIDIRGIRQVCSKHKNQMTNIAKLAEGIKTNEYKYIESFEFDGEASVKGALIAAEQISRLKINCEHKFTLKFRKLGNYKARGMYFNESVIVAEEVRDTSALLHEIAHFIHMSNQNIYESEFVNYMIEKLGKRINFDNINELLKNDFVKKPKYYTSHKEIIARALEIAALIANEQSRVIFSSGEYELIKSREYYELREGVYFDFNSFDEQTKEEMLNLWELFYETSHDDIKNTFIDNFYKIDTNYRRVELEKVQTLDEIVRFEKKKKEAELKALYSMVTGDNIKLIIDNKPNTLRISELAFRIFKNIKYCGAYKKSNTVNDWVNIIEKDWSKIFLILNDELKTSFSNRDYVHFLIKLESLNIIDDLRNYIGLYGFKIDFRLKLKKAFKEADSLNYNEYKEWESKAYHTVIEFAESELLEDVEFLKSYVSNKPFVANALSKIDGISEKTIMEIGQFMLDEMIEYKSLIPELCFKDSNFVYKFMQITQDTIIFYKVTTELKNNVTFMNKVLQLFDGDKLIDAFANIGNNLSTDIEFMEHWIKQEPKLIRYVDESIKEHFEPKKEVVVEVVAKTTKTKKVKSLKEKIDDIKEIQVENFEKLIESGTIEDFKHTKNGQELKILKITEFISDFKAFNEWLIKNGIAYYSKYAQGFIIKNIEKVLVKRLEAASILATSLYSTDCLVSFANGTLF